MEAAVLIPPSDPALPALPMREMILAQYSDVAARAAREQALDEEELLAYLAAIDPAGLSPLQGILQQTEAIGDPAMPSPEQLAILEWLTDAFNRWQRDYPLDTSVATVVRALLPMIAGIAVTDATFLTPGQHPLHRLMDSIQAYALGWQPSLGRGGDALEKQLREVVTQCSSWFQLRRLDITAIGEGLERSAQREQARARRMATRVVEGELGRLRTAEARRQAAAMINEALMRHRAPLEVGAFLKGPWYESAQFVLLKFGHQSGEWAELDKLTQTLLDSLRGNASEQPQLAELAAALPAQLRRWLVSLQHDPDAAEKAVQPIEAAHLAMLRGIEVTLHNIDPILLPDSRKAVLTRAPAVINTLQPGRWFRIQKGPGESLRLQLALKIESEQQLLFTNQAGVKALILDYREFARLMDQKRVVALRSGASFSRCLAKAAGIESDQALDELIRLDSEQRQQEQHEKDQARARKRAREQATAEAARAAEQLLHSQRMAAQVDLQEAERRAAEVEQARQEQALQLRQETRKQAVQERQAEEVLLCLQEEEDELLLSLEKAPHDEVLLKLEAAQDNQTSLTLEQMAGSLSQDIAPAPAETAPAPAADTPVEGDSLRVHIAMGTWLGFHDGDIPLMAKLAVHDREQDHYIFVNREGIKMRELSGQHLLTLVQAQHVDILETSSSFRLEVSRALHQQKD